MVHQREFQKIKCVPAVVDWFISVGLTEVNSHFYVKFHDSDFFTKSKFVNFSPSNKNELVSLLAKGQYPIICVKSFSHGSGYLSVSEYDYIFSVNEVINEEHF